jgi:NRPS condensation-like uncharacterized protein
MKRELGYFESAQALTNEHFPFNAVIVLHITNAPDEETLKEALTYVQARHPLLRVHIRNEKKRYFFESEGTPEIPLKVVKRESDDHWQQVVEEELNSFTDFRRGPPARLTCLDVSGSNKKCELIVSFHHAIADAPSALSLLHEILSLCKTIDSREAVDEAKAAPMELRSSAEAFFPPGFKGARRVWRNFRFILRQMGDEFLFRLRSRGCRKAPIHGSSRCKILPMKISRETSTALWKRSVKKKITLNNLFNAAMLIAVQKHLYDGKACPMRHFNFADLRPYLSPPQENRYLGSYFSMMRFTVNMKENPDVWELAREIGDITYGAFKRGDKYCSNLLSRAMMKAIIRFKAFRMGTAAMSYAGPLTVKKHYGKTDVHDLHAFVSNFYLGPEYTAQVRGFDKHFYWDIVYLDTDMDTVQAAVIADEIRSILDSAAKEEN